MPLILYTQTPDDQQDLVELNRNLDVLMPQLPESRQEKYRRLRHIQTRATSILGLLLLKHGMHKLGVTEFSFDELVYSKTFKPQCRNRYDFNISHSHTLAACVISTSASVGIDVEKVRDIKHERFERLQLFAGNKIVDMNTKDFFNLWTQKEAVVKADGSAGVWDIGNVEIAKNTATFRNKTWWLSPVAMPDGFIANVAHDSQSEGNDINLISISADKLIACTHT